MRVIYIAGSSHSGSTLLSLMLNANPEIMSVGEIQNLGRQLKIKPKRQKYTRCSCGTSSLWECAFWTAVDECVQKRSGKSLANHNMLDYSDLNKFRASNAVVFKAISDISGNRFIVDSSKDPKRMAYLMRFRDVEVYPIHLIRKPEGQINSVLKKRGSLLKSVIHYELVHAQIRWLLKSVPHGVVHYEDLVLEPESTLTAVLKPLGLEFDPQQLRWSDVIAHDVAGNHMRWSKTNQLVLDQSWKSDLTTLQRRVIRCGTLTSRQANPGTGYVNI